MKAVILQPSYVPWRGFFHQIQKADVFVFYDDVQYDARGWRNRNRIKTAQGPAWLTIPVFARGAQVEKTLIKDIRICQDRPWARKHWTAIRHAYSRAPYFGRYAPMIEALYERDDELLVDFTIACIRALAEELALGGQRYLRSSALPATGAKTERLQSLLAAIGSRHYISGPSARAYIDEARLEAAGVSLEFMTYTYPEYEQLHPPYEPHVSVIDLLFMKGPEAPRFIWGSEEP